MNTLNAYRAIEGKIPSKRDLSGWPEKKFMNFLYFCEQFMVPVENGGYRITITTDRLKKAEEVLMGPTSDFQEFLYRINQFTTDSESSTRKFYYKHASFIRQVLGYLKVNPAAITEEMKAIIEPNNRYNWCLRHTKVYQTKIGAEVVIPDTLDNVSFQKQHVASANPDKKLIDSLIQVASVFEMIANSLKKKDLEKLSTKDKIMALSKLSFIHATARNFKPTNAVFNKINVYSANKEDLEKSILAYGQVSEQ